MLSPNRSVSFALVLMFCPAIGNTDSALMSNPPTVAPNLPAQLYPVTAVRLLPGPFADAVRANREYVLALDADKLLAPFRREAGLKPRKDSYGNWENIGLDGHTAGHYLSALASLIATGQDTPDGELKRRLKYMVSELAECQTAAGDGYVGGVPGSKALWAEIGKGNVDAINRKWVPWYNIHKTYAGLRDAFLLTGNEQAKTVLVGMTDWALSLAAKLSDDQLQRMLAQEHGGINESFADVYAITGDKKYLALAQRFNHLALLKPLREHQDRLTGLHANTQIPKVIGFSRIAQLQGSDEDENASRFFWDTVTKSRSVAFGGNSVSEHFNDPKDFNGLVQHREGPETCNTYNMLRLTESLFAAAPEAKYVDFYERALFNHILGSINVQHPGYVYFTPLRPGHYRVYSQPGEGFWCCVGTGMENPGRYGQFVYAKSQEGVYVNLFLASELTDASRGLTLRQETKFPDEGRTRLRLSLKDSQSFTLFLRHPSWVDAGKFEVKVNGQKVSTESAPTSYAAIKRQWKDGDQIEVSLPMQTTVEKLPDNSDWVSILHGPIVLASTTTTADQPGLFAGPGRGDHIAQGPLVPIDSMPSLLSTPEQLPKQIVPDQSAGPLHFKLTAPVSTSEQKEIKLMPFFRLQESRYQLVWDLTSKEKLAAKKAEQAALEKAKIERDRATIDRVAVGEQQPEVDHEMTGEGLETGFHNGRRWRHGRVIQYTLNLRGAKNAELEVTYSGDDANRTFDIFVNDQLLTTQTLRGDKRGGFIDVKYPLTTEMLENAKEGKLVIRFVGRNTLAGGLYDLRLLRKTGGTE
ncbi:Beta-L-arabinofuranosidase, GH127 [Fimbriimonadaceae bacterium]